MFRLRHPLRCRGKGGCCGGRGSSPRGGCWVPPVQRVLVLGKPVFFYLNSKHHSFFWENLAVKVWSGDFVAFLSSLFPWYIARSGWEASLLSGWGLSGSSFQLVGSVLPDETAPRVSPRKVCGAVESPLGVR